jgi:hypothetical protein
LIASAASSSALADLMLERRVDLLGREFAFRLAGQTPQFLLDFEDRMHRFMGREERLQNRLFVDDLGAPFEHHDRVGIGRDHHRDVAVVQFIEQRVDYELTVDAAHADGRDRTEVRDIGDLQRGRGGD